MRGRVTALTASVDVDASPANVARVVLEPGFLPQWFYSVKRVEADPEWPRVGSSITVHVGPRGGTLFVGRMVEDRRPAEVVMGFKTPSGGSRIIHRFDPLDDGARCRLTKIVEPRYVGANRYVPWLLDYVIRASMKREVRKVARIAEALGPA